MFVRAAFAAVLLAGCTFDASGSHAPLPETNVDAAPVADAGPPCVDRDGDGFSVARESGEDCGPVDCDDADERVHPEQAEAFTTPAASGGFDYDCDGVETPAADTARGGDCRQPIFGPCEGTGWIGEVPACGASATWHRCEPAVLSCNETERAEITMPCR